MVWLVIGLALWVGAHLFKRVLPAQRAALGNRGRLLVAVGGVAGVGLMIYGYNIAPVEPIYVLPFWVWYVNNLLMLPALALLDIGRARGVVRTRIRHPMLTGLILWAVAHLLVNGDVPSLILFGGLAAWALATMALINRAEGPWQPPEPGSPAADLRVLAVAVVLYVLIVAIHEWRGYSVFVLF